MDVSVVGHGVDLLVGQNLHMLAAGPTVQLVDPDQPAAHMVRHFALLAYMLREIRRGLIGYLSEIRRHHNHQYVYSCLIINLEYLSNGIIGPSFDSESNFVASCNKCIFLLFFLKLKNTEKDYLTQQQIVDTK